ncbi:hypothetical protein BDV95DRAFT_154047 [Massariosphaeria phaeospora]|uniref:Uncharacterized protein n=1 Tax=Massariosphaeria phaeospora TaxID=100035 RepID=A0A7C8IEI7_9PLEO|nr:hypothetical protein BDV95DRAFT_154047 [Massariosphaeria phaeospora]
MDSTINQPIMPESIDSITLATSMRQTIAELHSRAKRLRKAEALQAPDRDAALIRRLTREIDELSNPSTRTYEMPTRAQYVRWRRGARVGARFSGEGMKGLESRTLEQLAIASSRDDIEAQETALQTNIAPLQMSPTTSDKTQPPFCFILASLAFLGVSSSLALSLWWSIAHADVSGGFTMGAYIVAVFGVPMGVVGYRHSQTCRCWERAKRGKALSGAGESLELVGSSNTVDASE